MSLNDSLGDRMKTYEDVSRHHVMKRTPTIIRLDGRAFHTLTKCLKHYDDTMTQTPFSIKMHEVMTLTMMGTMSQMQNAVFGYTQSDEISILLRDWDRHETQQWFDGVLQKMVSVSASTASVIFNYFFDRDVRKAELFGDLAQFDARIFNLPEAEVANYFIWRQQDASRNSVQMLGRFHFSQKQMHGLSNVQVQEMLKEKNADWNDIPTWMKRGTCAFPNPVRGEGVDAILADENPPVFTIDRDYVMKHLLVPESKEQGIIWRIENASVAQRSEQGTLNSRVVGSNPTGGARYIIVMAAKLQPILDQKRWAIARQIIKDEFVSDPNPGGMRYSFLANIAMMMYDKYGLDLNIANSIADDVIKLAFEDTYY